MKSLFLVPTVFPIEGFDLQLNVGGADISFPMKSVTVERSNSGVIEVNWPSKTLKIVNRSTTAKICLHAMINLCIYQ